MRTPPLLLLLALAGTALSGCAGGFDDAYVQSGVTTGGGGTGGSTDTGGGSISGGGDTGTGGDNEVTLTAGDIAIAFTQDGRSLDGTGKASIALRQLNNGEFANAAISPGSSIGFGGAKTLGLYLKQTNPSPAVFPQYAVQNAEYSEFRKITGTSDDELQYWQFNNADGNSYAGQFRDVTNKQWAWFFGGNSATDPTVIDGLKANNVTATYNGHHAGVAEVANWGDAASYQKVDGEWRYNGTGTYTANFAADTFNGTLTTNYWEKYDDGKLVAIDIPNNLIKVGADTTGPIQAFDTRSFHYATIELNGTISANQIAGKAALNTQSNGYNIWVNGDQAMYGGFYGANAGEVTGVYSTYAVLPAPIGGDTGINDDRRGIVDLSGMFHGE